VAIPGREGGFPSGDASEPDGLRALLGWQPRIFFPDGPIS
jgi:hypothetical protein